MIFNAGRDERGKYSGGKAGDQGSEVVIRSWYKRPWQVVLRYQNREVAQAIADIAKATAENDNVGYDQSQRLAFFNELRKTYWQPENIETPCETDCSASTAAIVIAAGHRCGMPKLQQVNPSLTTRNLRKNLVNAGFTAYVDGIYTGSDKFLLPGDILLLEGHHAAINLSKGKGDDRLLEIAKEVKAGLWDTGAKRKAALGAAGWNPVEVQAEVNLLMWG